MNRFSNYKMIKFNNREYIQINYFKLEISMIMNRDQWLVNNSNHLNKKPLKTCNSN